MRGSLPKAETANLYSVFSIRRGKQETLLHDDHPTHDDVPGTDCV